MIVRRMLTVGVILAVGLSAIVFLPRSPQASPAGIVMTLPIWVGNWIGEDTPVTQRELDVLAKDTRFARKVYTGPQGDKMFVSIVLSGDDMSSSIHRPERCLPAQGWSLFGSSRREVKASGLAPLGVTRLSNAREVTADGQRLTVHNLTYYWFVGYDTTTPSHLSRTMIDMRDRILRGVDQRWAYVTVAANVTEGLVRNGRSERETGKMNEVFIQKLETKPQQPTDAHTLVPSKS